jgi:hypothetical protein
MHSLWLSILIFKEPRDLSTTQSIMCIQIKHQQLDCKSAPP